MVAFYGQVFSSGKRLKSGIIGFLGRGRIKPEAVFWLIGVRAAADLGGAR